MNTTKSLKSKIGDHLFNIRGWRTDRKIIVLESDDWGAIRMSSKKAFNNLSDAGIDLSRDPFNRLDSLATEEDLSALFDVLKSVKDEKGRHPVFTANAIMANPDFDKIKANNFTQYFYEPFTKTLSTYPDCQNSFSLWQQGIEEKIFFPQFHGREHVNVPFWMQELRANNSNFRLGFENRLYGLGPKVIPDAKRNIQAANEIETEEELTFLKESVKQGLEIFKDTFGFSSKSFVACNYIWPEELNPTLANNGVEIIQGMRYQKLPPLVKQKNRKILHHLGKVNSLGQLYLIRNSIFEPGYKGYNIDNVRICFDEIKTAFFWKKPVIISTHRLNYVGKLSPENRKINLDLLGELLRSIVKKWPDVEFMTSVELSEAILNNQN